MLISTGILSLLGSIPLVGQLISSVDFELAQRLGLQEKDDETEPLFRRLELNAARWDLVVLWTLPVAGILMLLGHAWWPYATLVAGGVWVDAGGREIAKHVALRHQGIKVGTPREQRSALAFLWIMLAVGLWVTIYAWTAVV
jgi:hypothetical protein